MAATPADEMETSAARPPLPHWTFLDSLPPALAAGEDRIAAFRQALADGGDSLRQRFEDDEPIEALVRDRARMVDVVLCHAWALRTTTAEKDVALIAVGVDGRGERHPGSDSDVVILRLRAQEGIGSSFITVLERYSQQVKAVDGRLMVAGISNRPAN